MMNSRTAWTAFWIVLAAAGCAAGASEPAAIALHPAVGDTITADEAARFGLFPDLPDLRSAVLRSAPWGGYLVRLELRGADGPAVRERNVPTASWRAWRARIDRILAGGAAAAPPDASAGGGTAAAASDTAVAAAPDPVPAPADTAVAPPARRRRVWPEAPLPERTLLPAPASPAAAETVVISGRWLARFELGYKSSTTVFGDYFTDQAMAVLQIGRTLGDHFMPWFGFQYAYGDIPDDFEKIAGNGHSALYAVEAGLEVRTALKPRLDAYLTGGGGFYMRSLRWGGQVFLGYDGIYRSGTAVRELQDWGWTAGAGLRWNLSPLGRRVRLLEFGFHLEGYPADRVLLENEEQGVRILADDRDLWWGVHLGLVVGL